MGVSNAWRLGMKSLLTPGTRTLKASAVGLDSLTPLWLIISPLSTRSTKTISSELICTLTGNIVNKSEEHINGKRFLNMLEGNEQKKKRMKADSDISRPTPSVRNDLDALASLKDLKYLMRSLVMMKRVAARECTSCLGHILYLSQSGMIPLVLEISLLGNKFWLCIRQQLHCIKQL